MNNRGQDRPVKDEIDSNKISAGTSLNISVVSLIFFAVSVPTLRRNKPALSGVSKTNLGVLLDR